MLIITGTSNETKNELTVYAMLSQILISVFDWKIESLIA